MAQQVSFCVPLKMEATADLELMLGKKLLRGLERLDFRLQDQTPDMNLLSGQTWRAGWVLPGVHQHTIAYIFRLVKLPVRFRAAQNLDKRRHNALYFPITIVEDLFETD